MTTARKPSEMLADWLKANRSRYPHDVDFALAAAISGGRLSQILSGRGGRVRPQLAIAIHRLTRGGVPGSAWRPDLWRQPSDVPVPITRGS